MFEIYFNDLKQEVQASLLAFYGLSNASEGNYDVLPLFTLWPGESSEDSEETGSGEELPSTDVVQTNEGLEVNNGERE